MGVPNFELRQPFRQALQLLQQPAFEIKDTEISSRMINYYNTREMLYAPLEPNKTKKFTAVEIVWIKILKELLDFGFSGLEVRWFKDSLLQYEHADRKVDLSLDCLTFHITMMTCYEIDFKIVLTRGESMEWQFITLTHQEVIANQHFSFDGATLLIPLLPKIKNEWKRLSGKALNPKHVVYTPIQLSEKDLLNAIKEKNVQKIELSFSEKSSTSPGKGKVVKTFEEIDVANLLKLLRYMTYGEVRLTYGSEAGVPLHGMVSKTIKFKNRTEAINEIVRHTK